MIAEMKGSLEKNAAERREIEKTAEQFTKMTQSFAHVTDAYNLLNIEKIELQSKAVEIRREALNLIRENQIKAKEIEELKREVHNLRTFADEKENACLDYQKMIRILVDLGVFSSITRFP
jgi:predicted  nucleic acid-binding Zn-ribbon protein